VKYCSSGKQMSQKLSRSSIEALAHLLINTPSLDMKKEIEGKSGPNLVYQKLFYFFFKCKALESTLILIRMPSISLVRV
jgi:hypothetical protein